MYIDMTRGKPVKCSKCGSTNAVKPINSRDIAIRCEDCGHTKLTHEAEQRRVDDTYGRGKSWNLEKDADPTF